MTKFLAALVIGALFLSGMAARAAPEIALATEMDAAPDTPITVVANGLEPARSYWITIVPEHAEPGSYEEFHYVEAMAETRLDFTGLPAGDYEIRLHRSGDGDPMVARLALSLGEVAAESAAGPTASTRAFAAAHGLNGDWTGSYTCADGSADVTLTLWMGAHEGSYQGRMRATLRDGPDAGAMGEWPAYAQHSPRHGTVGLGFEAPLAEPRPQYQMAGLREAALSEEGTRIEGGSFVRHGCTDFSLTRMPIPEPEAAAEAARAMTQRGFFGNWTGAYSCAGQETALDLEFTRDSVTGRLHADWRYSGGEGRGAFAGAVRFRVTPASGNAVDLLPLTWIEQPYRHTASPVVLRAAPDQRRLQGEVAGCGPVEVARVAMPAQPLPSDHGLMPAALREELAGLEGVWEGTTQCGETTTLMRLDIAAMTGENLEADFRYVAAEDVDVATWLRLNLTYGLHSELRVTVAERMAWKQNGPVHVPSAVVPHDPQISARFVNMDCEQVLLSRPVSPAALPLGAPAEDAPAGTVLALADGRLRPAPDAVACAALGSWAAALTAEERALNRAGSFILGWGGWPALFAGDRFAPVFGAPYPVLAGSPEAGRHVRQLVQRECRAAGLAGAAEMIPVLDAAFGLDRNNGFGSDHHRFRMAADRAQRAADGLPALLAEVEGMPRIPATDAEMAALRDTEFLGTHDEVGRLPGLLQACLAVLNPDRPQLVEVAVTSAERGQILHQHLEDKAALDRRGEHSLDVLHHEGGGPKLVENPDVLAEQVVTLILFRHVAALASGAGPSHERIGLAGRPADQDRVVEVAAQLRDGAVDRCRRGFGTEFQAARLIDGDAPCFGVDRRPVRFGDLPRMEVDELLGQGVVPCLVFPQECAQCQGAMCRGLLLDRDADPEGRMPVLDEGGKALAKSARTGKKIDDTESGWQIRLLTKIIHRVYTRFGSEDQEARDGYCRQADPLPDDGRDQGQGHQARAGAPPGAACARLPLSASFPESSWAAGPGASEALRRRLRAWLLLASP